MLASHTRILILVLDILYPTRCADKVPDEAVEDGTGGPDTHARGPQGSFPFLQLVCSVLAVAAVWGRHPLEDLLLWLSPLVCLSNK